MKVIVTGASGQFARLAVDDLLKRLPPQDLILVTRKPEDLKGLAARGAAVRYGDFDKPESLAAAFEGGEKMLLVSATRVGKRLPQHKAAIDAAKAAGVRHVVYTSFVKRKGRESDALVNKDHAGTEKMLEQSGMAWSFLRDSWYADAIATAIAPRALSQGKWITSCAEGHVAPVARADCAACAAAILTGEGHENKAYDITGPDRMSVAEIAALVADMGGRPIDVLRVSDDDMYAMFDAMGVPREPVDDQTVGAIPWCSDDMVSFERAIREGDLDVVSQDVEKLLGRPPVGLKDLFLSYASAWPAPQSAE